MVPFDLNGLITAIISAGLLTFAVVYVARSRRSALDLETPLIEAFSSVWTPGEREMFSTEIASGGRPGLGLVASAAVHLLESIPVRG